MLDLAVYDHHIPPPFLQPPHQLPLTDHQLRTDLIEGVCSIQKRKQLLVFPHSSSSSSTIPFTLTLTTNTGPSTRRRSSTDTGSFPTTMAPAPAHTPPFPSPAPLLHPLDPLDRPRRKRVPVHPIQQPLDHAEGDEAPYVELSDDVRVLVLDPAAEGERGREGEVEWG